MTNRATQGSERDVVMDFSDRPYAYDPTTQPEYFAGVLGRRTMAFIFDFVLVVCLTVLAYGLLFVLGIITLGLAWLVLGILAGAMFPVIALAYSAYTMSRPASATVGMRMFDLQIRTWYGDRMNGLLGAFHTLVYYFSVTMLTPFILLVPFFNARKRALHDYLTGTVVINSEMRADIYRDSFKG